MPVGQSPFGFASAAASRVANYGVGGAPTGAPGLLSQVGGWLGQNPALTMGIGALGMSALGRSSVGGAPYREIPYTEAGKKLKAETIKSVKGAFPENLAAQFRGIALKTLQIRKKAFGKRFQGATITGPDRAISGNVARAFLTQTQGELKGAQEGPRLEFEARRQHELNRLGRYQNIINLGLGTPVMQAEADLISQATSQRWGAQRGAALGGIAQLLATNYAYRGVR